jgi:hypothetical protein
MASILPSRQTTSEDGDPLINPDSFSQENLPEDAAMRLINGLDLRLREDPRFPGLYPPDFPWDRVDPP